MEQRFGVKDFFLFLLLAVLIVVVILAMMQFDRQWKEIREIKTALSNQTTDLSTIRQTLASGNFNVGGGVPATRPAGFEVTEQSRLEAVTKLPGYAPGDWLVQATASPPTKLTPLLDADLFGSRVQDMIFDSLVKRNPETLGFMPRVAEWWEQSEDGKTLTFHLRRDVVFSDGQPLTADDVVYSFKLALNPEIEAERTRVYLQYIDQVQAPDKYTVRFTFKQFYFQNFETVGSISILPRHFYEKYTPRQFNESVGLVLGSGPYRVSNPTGWAYEPGKPFEVVRNERYWGVRPPFDRVIWYMQPDPGARLISFKNGDTDRIGATPEQYREMIKDPKVTERADSYKFVAPDDGYMYIGWFQVSNGKKTPFADKRVRQAMTLLIDRQAIVNNVLYGFGQVATGPFDPNGLQADRSIQAWPFDPERGRQLLAEAGYVDRNGDGIVESADGTPLKFKLSFPSASTLLERACIMVRDTLRSGGVQCETEAVEWSVLIERIKNKQVEAQISGWGGSIEGDLYQIFHSSGIAGTGDNRVSYANPELDKAIEQARTTVDTEARNKLWQQCHAILHEDQPYTFLFTDDNLLFVDKRFQNVKLDKLGVNSFREWFVPAEKQKWGK